MVISEDYIVPRAIDFIEEMTKWEKDKHEIKPQFGFSDEND